MHQFKSVHCSSNGPNLSDNVLGKVDLCRSLGRYTILSCNSPEQKFGNTLVQKSVMQSRTEIWFKWTKGNSISPFLNFVETGDY